MFVETIQTILITVTHPNLWYTYAAGALEFFPWTFFIHTIRTNLIFPIRTLLNTIASFRIVNAECRLVGRCTALELFIEANESVAILFVGTVAALITTIAYMHWCYTIRIIALILARFTLECSTIAWLVAAVTAIVARITTPKEWHTLFGCCTLKLGRRTIGDARFIVSAQIELVRTFAFVEWWVR